MRSSLAGLVAIVAPIAIRAQASTPVGAQIQFEAELAKPAASAHGPFKAAGAEFSCTTTHCSGRGVNKDPTGTCAAVAKTVGALKSFTAGGHPLDVTRCNPPAPAMVAAPMNRSVPAAAVPAATKGAVATAPVSKSAASQAAPTAGKGAAAAAAPKPLAPAAAPAPSPKPAPSSPPKKGGAASGGLAFTAAAMTVTGTGAAPTYGKFTPLAWTTAGMSVSGTGALAPARAPAGIVFTTDTMRVTGSP